MRQSDYEKNMNQLIIVADELKEHLEDIVFVGGCTVVLLVDDAAQHAARPTEDVDIVINVAALSEYYEFVEKLRKKGFSEDAQSGVMCRYKKGNIVLDVMSASDKVLGFTNIWYTPALQRTDTIKLPSDVNIQVISPVYFIATKIEAFKNRGQGDYLSADIEDIVSVIENREQILIEIKSSDDELRHYLKAEFEKLDNDDFWNYAPGYLNDSGNEFILENAFAFIKRMD